jgi:predicted metal-dependent hydrolase
VVLFVRHRLARRYILRVEPDGALRVTMPRGGSRHGALDFIERQRPWIERQRRDRSSGLPVSREWRAGTTVFFRGVPVTLHVDCAGAQAVVCLDDQRVPLPDAYADLRPAITRHFRRLAHRELKPWLERLARQHGLTVKKVIIRNQRSLWGSCAPSGTISLNWRLLQMPHDVAEYVILHELMHLREANHSTRYWAHVASVCPAFEQHRRWLRRHGRVLW